MKRPMFKVGILAVMLGASGLIIGCSRKAGQKDEVTPRVQAIVTLTPGKASSSQDQAKVSTIGLKVLDHVAQAQQDLQAKKVDAAKKELTQAGKLLDILKGVLPTVEVIDNIWDTKTSLSYINTTEVQQDMVSILASIDQLYDVLPAGTAKEHAKQAKDILTKEKKKGAPKAKEELEAVEESLNFHEVDLSVSYTSRLIKVAQGDLEKGKTKEASEALNDVADGLLFFDTTVINPMDVAVRRIWMATQDYAGKDYKAAKNRLGMAKTALQDISQSGNKTQQDGAKDLIGKIDAIDVMKAADKTGAALGALWQDTRKLVDQPLILGSKQSDSQDKTDKVAKITNQTFIRAADQIDLAEMKLGKIAEDHATSDAVKKFGVRMVSDHSLMNKELREITSKKGIKLAAGLDSKDQGLMDELSKLKGPEFNQAYTKDMVSGHEKAIAQFEIEAKDGSDPDVKAWAQKWLPTLREHLTLAQDAVKDINRK